MITISNNEAPEEIPRNLTAGFRSLEEYQIHCALRNFDDQEIGKMFNENILPPNTPIFRGTDEERYQLHQGELWWTFNLAKSANYARKNSTPLILVGSLGDIAHFEDVQYLEDSLYIASQEQYSGSFAVRPLFTLQKTGLVSMCVFDGLERIEGGEHNMEMERQLERDSNQFEEIIAKVDLAIYDRYDIDLIRLGEVEIPEEEVEISPFTIDNYAERFEILPSGLAIVSFASSNGNSRDFLNRYMSLGLDCNLPGGIMAHPVIFDKKSLNQFIREHSGTKNKSFFDAYIRKYNVHYPIVIQARDNL